MFVSGSEIGWDLDHEDNGRSFFQNIFKSKFVADDADSYQVAATDGGIFAGMPEFSFDKGARSYDADHPDVFEAQGGAKVALKYANSAGAAGILAPGNGARGIVVMLGFPFETINSAQDRAEVMRRVLDFFNVR